MVTDWFVLMERNLAKKETQTKDARDTKNQVLKGKSLLHHHIIFMSQHKRQVQLWVSRQKRRQDAEKVHV